MTLARNLAPLFFKLLISAHLRSALHLLLKGTNQCFALTVTELIDINWRSAKPSLRLECKRRSSIIVGVLFAHLTSLPRLLILPPGHEVSSVLWLKSRSLCDISGLIGLRIQSGDGVDVSFFQIRCLRSIQDRIHNVAGCI